jgi:8-oxo-dGTP pyrophosphatase MutT (NUDIX family)
LQERLARRLATTSPVELTPDPEEAINWAAVSVILAPDPDAVLLIRRAERAGDPWSGHIGLPGGRADPGDRDLRETALRETAEEVGWQLRREQLIGQLDDVWPRAPLHRVVVVRPFVFAAGHRPAMALSEEVAEAFWVPVDRLRNPSIYRDAVLDIRGQPRAFPAYHLERDVIWGFTERILTPLLSLI